MSNDKLPTPAEILEKHHPYSQGFTILDSTYEGGDVAKAMQEHTSAHTAALRQEVERLKAWKESASSIINEVDLQSLAKKLGIGLGESISANIGPKIDELTGRTKDVERLSGINNRLTGWLNSEIEYLESIDLTDHGHGALSAFIRTREKLEAIK